MNAEKLDLCEKHFRVASHHPGRMLFLRHLAPAAAARGVVLAGEWFYTCMAAHFRPLSQSLIGSTGGRGAMSCATPGFRCGRSISTGLAASPIPILRWSCQPKAWNRSAVR